MHLPNATPPCLSCIHFFNGERVLDLQGHLTMAESHLVAVQWGILANRYLLIKCKLAVLPCWLQHVHVHFAFLNASYFSLVSFPDPQLTRLTEGLGTRLTSHSLIIATGLRDADRNPLGSRRSSGSAGRTPSCNLSLC